MDAHSIFLAYVKSISNLSLEEEKQLLNIVNVISFEKGECILKAGEKFTSYYFLCKGCLRFHSWKNDTHNTLQLITKPEFATDILSIKKGNPACNNLCSVTDSTVIQINAQELEELFSSSINFEYFGRKLTEKIFVIFMKRIHEYMFNTPEENYLQLLENSPDVIQKISQQDIASFLGITPQSLSRIKSRIFLKS